MMMQNQPSNRQRIFMRILIFLLVIEVVFPVLLYLGRNRLIFLPSAEPGPEAGLDFLTGRAAVELVHIARPDGRQLAAYDGRPRQWQEADGPVVIFFHGNAGNIAYRAPLLEMIVAGLDARVVMFDYSGYGGNEGSPSEQEVIRDGLAVYDHLVAEIPAERLVLYGESLGGAVALAVAAQRPCAGVVLQSTFSSLSSLALRIYPWMPLASVLARRSFPSSRRIAGIEAPVLVVHGTRDEIIPLVEGEKLHAAALPGTELLVIERAGHNDFFAVAGEAYLADLRRRLRQWVSQ